MSPRKMNCGLCGDASSISLNSSIDTIDASSMMIVEMLDGNGFSLFLPGSNLIERFDVPSSRVIHTSVGAYSRVLWIVMQHG